MVTASFVTKMKSRKCLKNRNEVQGLSNYVPPKRTFADLLNLKMVQVPLILLALVPEMYFSHVPWDATLNSGARSRLLCVSQFFYHFVLGLVIPLTYIMVDDKIHTGYLQLKKDTMNWMKSKFWLNHRLSRATLIVIENKH
eukprot:TCALIF_12457-PA protein Name:"Protein of unknown function" AED:0.12 eAED:0.12 QI:13/1/0.66/1/0/0/3/0/140